MAAPATKPLTIVATEPTTASPLQLALQDRSRVTEEIARLTGVSARLTAEANGEAALLAQLADLGKAETAEMQAWANAGATTAAPAAKSAERQSIATKLAVSRAKADAARSAITDIDAQIAEQNRHLRTTDEMIERAALDAMQADLTDIRAEHLAAIERVRKSSAKLLGLCSYLTNEGRRRIDSGDVEAGKRYLARAEAMNAIKLPSSGLTQGEIIEAANNWSRRAATLRTGA